MPFENSSNGSVVFTLDLFADQQNRYPDILVTGEIYLPVHHCLLGHARRNSSTKDSTNDFLSPKTKPTWHQHTFSDRDDDSSLDSSDRSGAVTPTQAAPEPQKPHVKPIHDISHIKKLYSHPQAWGQCKLFLSAYLKQTERQDVSSTSKAAEFVAEDISGTTAAISSRIAAELNGLNVLAENIEDIEGNSTRFFVLQRKQDVLPSDEVGRDEASEGCRWKTLVSFTLNHSEAGLLADCLEVFRKHDLNLTSINTRPSGEAPWHYIFFVEFNGNRLPIGRGGAVNEALEELTEVARSWRWLGSWENALDEN